MTHSHLPAVLSTSEQDETGPIGFDGADVHGEVFARNLPRRLHVSHENASFVRSLEEDDVWRVGEDGDIGGVVSVDDPI